MQQLNLYQKIPPKKAGTNLIAIILPREKQTFFLLLHEIVLLSFHSSLGEFAKKYRTLEFVNTYFMTIYWQFS